MVFPDLLSCLSGFSCSLLSFLKTITLKSSLRNRFISLWSVTEKQLCSFGIVKFSWFFFFFNISCSLILYSVLVTQSCPTLFDPMDCSLPGSSVHRNLQARTLEWVSVFFSRGSSRPRDRTQVSCIAGRFFALWVTKEVLILGALQFLLWKLRIIVLTSVCS